MGMYANHGIEYHVVLKNGQRIVVAPMKQTDARLVQSDFFRVRENTWLSADVMYRRGSYVIKIDDNDFDVQLTPEENKLLNEVIDLNSSNVHNHGWYDVNVIDCSYDW